MSEPRNPARVAISGEFTIFNAAVLRDRLLAALDEADEVEVDLADVTEIDSSGVQMMVAAQREAEERHKRLGLAGISPAVAEVLRLTGLADRLGASRLQSPA